MPENYSAKVLEHYHRPRNFGKLKKPTHRSAEANPQCGDEITVYLDIGNGKIRNIKYEARGCALVIASASALSEEAERQALGVGEIKKMGKKDIERLLGVKVGKAREQCALLALNTIKKSLSS